MADYIPVMVVGLNSLNQSAQIAADPAGNQPTERNALWVALNAMNSLGAWVPVTINDDGNITTTPAPGVQLDVKTDAAIANAATTTIGPFDLRQYRFTAGYYICSVATTVTRYFSRDPSFGANKGSNRSYTVAANEPIEIKLTGLATHFKITINNASGGAGVLNGELTGYPA